MDGLSQMPKVSIHILNYNGQKYLERCLNSIRNTTYKDYQVTLIDNNSEDDSVTFVRKNFPEILIVQNKRNYGFAEGSNKCLRKLKDSYVVLLGSDTEVESTWLEELIKLMETDNTIGICGGKLLLFDRARINSCGGECNVYGFAADRGIFELDKGQFNKTEEVFYVCGTLMLIRSKVLQHIGFFDSKYFMYSEDTDLCWRARLHGYKVIYVPRAIVYHKFGGVGGSANPTRLYLSKRNMMRTLIKNCGTSLLLSMLSRFLAMGVAETIFFLISGHVRFSLASIKAIVWNIKNIPDTYLARKEVQKLRRVPDSDIKHLLSKRNIELELFRRGYLSKFKKTSE